MATFNIFGYTFDHLASVRAMSGNSYRVFTEDGYYIHKPTFGELEYKTVTMLYETDDLANVVIVAEADLPPDAIICGGEDNDHEVMSEPNTEVTE
jgi:hypothetical protein